MLQLVRFGKNVFILKINLIFFHDYTHKKKTNLPLEFTPNLLIKFEGARNARGMRNTRRRIASRLYQHTSIHINAKIDVLRLRYIYNRAYKNI